MTDVKAVVLSAPKNIDVNSGGEGLEFVTFQWSYQSSYGWFGAAVEIKAAHSQEYEPVKKVERAYMNVHGAA